MRNRVRAAAALLVLFGAAGAVVACGSSPGASSQGSASAPAAAPGQGGMQAYTACLGQHGVTLPSGGPRGNRPSGAPSGRPSRGAGGGRFGFGNQPPPGVDAATWQQAQQACASLRPSGRPGNGNNGANAAYRNCLSDHGVTASRGPGGLDANDPKVAAAMKACEPLRPTAQPAASPTA